MYQFLRRAQHFISFFPRIFGSRRLYKGYISSLNRCELVELVNELKQIDCGSHELTKKYLNWRWYLRENFARCVSVGLHKSPSVAILDLGSGPGYFLACAQYLGNRVIGLDTGDNPIYRSLIKFMQLPPVLIERIEPSQKLKTVGDQKFDLITAFSVTFHAVKDKAWSDDHWLFFFADLHRHLDNGGEIFLRFNTPKTKIISEPVLASLKENFDILDSDYRSLHMKIKLDRNE
jgi:SAM-dependent methyltransferase